MYRYPHDVQHFWLPLGCPADLLDGHGWPEDAFRTYHYRFLMG